MSDERVLFKRVEYDVGGLLHYVDIGDIGLPDIQRPFVWTASKVRDLFDSMYRGFPVGYLLFWANGGLNGSRQIGVGEKGHNAPSLLIVDGQQRLTSLYSVFRGKPVMDEDYNTRAVEIAFRPQDGKFEVTDAAIRRDPEFIPNISEMWASGKSSWSLVNDFLDKLQTKRSLDRNEKESISHNLDRLFDLQKYPFTALEISPTVEEEQVADIFVRINSEGVKLNQGDFILTLLSVFWDEGRAELEKFCRESRTPPARSANASPFNHFIKPAPDQLLRVSVALAFHRGRLKSVYQILRGKDPETGEFSPTKREEQFAKLRESHQEVLNLTSWHEFFNALLGAGFRKGGMISSENALLYAYAFFLIGRTQYKGPENELKKLIGRWFFATALAGRYTGSPETVMDGDLNRVKGLSSSQAFGSTLEKIINDTLTPDYWAITLPNELESSSARSPALFAFYAAQILLQAPALFSKLNISDLMDPTVKSPRKAIERHHLFPRALLERQGVTDLKEINQTANYTWVEWLENNEISDAPPSDYVPYMLKDRKIDDDKWRSMCELHALPEGWDNLPYDQFLSKRRILMAKLIQKAFESLA